MLQRIAEGVLAHESVVLQSNAVAVPGPDGALVVDAGVTLDELAQLARDVRALAGGVAAGFSTHPHWDHVLWHPDLGAAPRYTTAASAASMREQLSHDDWEAQQAEGLPPEHADEIPMHLLGLVTALPEGATHVPWAGPSARILEHRAHAPGHAALLLEDAGVLAAGDMLSDALVPFLDLAASDPVGDYLAALDMFEAVADRVAAVVPGHGSVGDQDALRLRIALDRAYVEDVRDGRRPDDPRLGPDAPHPWLADVDAWQRQQIAELGGLGGLGR